ncbi:MAG: hypothetical protein HDT35_04350 [Clostridiales bacterium]|nr:hypothetical protein [Clostridiales bacterium]
MKKLNKVLSVGLSLALCLSMLPMSAFAAGNPHLTCEQSVHEHDDSCYEQVSCTLGHTHSLESCGATGYTDDEHTHTEACYTDDLTCTTPEHTHDSSCNGCPYGYTHQHSNACYDRLSGNLVCGKEIHSEAEHNNICLRGLGGWQCGKTEHTHTADCHEKQLTCGKGAHTHDDNCVAGWACGKAEHDHSSGCNDHKELVCNVGEHTHTDACYSACADNNSDHNCDICGAKLSEHNAETIPGKAATCTDTGLTEGSKCSVCGETLMAQTEIPATGHTPETIPGKAATCTDTGLTDGSKCSVCGETLTAQTEIPATGHNYGDWTVVTPAAPGVKGLERRECQNEGCDAFEEQVIAAQPIEIPDDDTPLANQPDDDEVEIDDVDVPLAGLFTRADAIGYLWEQSGSPEWELSDFEDVPEDHQWAVAIGWAQDMGIAVADKDGNFCPDDLVLRSVEDIELSPEGELEQFLNRYAVYAGIELDEGELFIELEGSWDDIIMGEEAQVIFDDFFAKLELALAQAA